MSQNVLDQETWHGTRAGFVKHKCKCNACEAASRASKELKAEQMRAWRAANPERDKENNRRYKRENAEEINARRREIRQANPERFQRQAKDLRESDIERARARERAYHAKTRERRNELTRIRRAKNPDAANAAVAKWREKYPERWEAAKAKRGLKNRDAYLAKARLMASARRAMQARATIVPFTQAQLDARMACWGNRCYMCGGPFECVDHVKPLAVGGLHALSNLRPVCRRHNTSKKDRWYGVAWIASITGAVPRGQFIPRQRTG